MEVDHDKQVVYTETLALALHEPDLLLAAMQPSEEHVAGRLTSPIVSTHLDTRNIAFERWADTPGGCWGGNGGGGGACGGPLAWRWGGGGWAPRSGKGPCEGSPGGTAGEGEGNACARGRAGS